MASSHRIDSPRLPHRADTRLRHRRGNLVHHPEFPLTHINRCPPSHHPGGGPHLRPPAHTISTKASIRITGTAQATMSPLVSGNRQASPPTTRETSPASVPPIPREPTARVVIPRYSTPTDGHHTPSGHSTHHRPHCLTIPIPSHRSIPLVLPTHLQLSHDHAEHQHRHRQDPPHGHAGQCRMPSLDQPDIATVIHGVRSNVTFAHGHGVHPTHTRSPLRVPARPGHPRSSRRSPEFSLPHRLGP